MVGSGGNVQGAFGLNVVDIVCAGIAVVRGGGVGRGGNGPNQKPPFAPFTGFGFEFTVVAGFRFAVVAGFEFNGILVVVGSGGKVHGFPGLAFAVVAGFGFIGFNGTLVVVGSGGKVHGVVCGLCCVVCGV